jgi:PAS domain S-box-containing protein
MFLGERMGCKPEISKLCDEAKRFLEKAGKTDEAGKFDSLFNQIKVAYDNLAAENQRLRREVKERSKGENLLRERAQKFQAVFRSVHDGLFINYLDVKNQDIGPTIEVNQAACRLLGYSSAELCSLSPFETFLRNADQKTVIKKLLAGEEICFESNINCRDGNLVICDMRACPFSLEDDLFIVTVVRDIHDRRAAEKRLRESEAQLRTAQDIADLSDWFHDLQTGEFKWSEQMERIMGYKPEPEDKDSYEKLIKRIHPDDQHKVSNIKCNPLEHRKFSFYFRMNDKKGATHFILCRGKVELDDAGRAKRLIGVNQDVTEKHEAELRLKENENNLRSILEAVSVGIWEYIPETKTFCMDRSLKEFWGYNWELQNIPERRLWEKVHFQDLQRIKSEFKQMVVGKRPLLDCSLRQRNDAGEYVWILVRAVAVRNASGNVTRIVGCIEDLTESMRFDKLKEQSEFMQRIANIIPVPIFYKDMKGRYLGHNLAFGDFASEIFGKSVVGRTIDDLLSGKNRNTAILLDRIEKSLIKRGVGSASKTFKLVNADGEERIIVNHKSLLRGFDNEPLYVVGVLMDITELKLVENRLRQTTRRLNTTLNSMREMIMCFDENLNLQWGNRAARETFAGKGKKFIGRKWNELWPISDDTKIAEAPIKKILSGNENMLCEKVCTSNGRIYEVCAYPIKDTGGRITGVVEAALDITEHEQAETQAKMQKEQLIQADKMKSLGILVAGVAHEINNPNNFIGINVSIIEKIWKDILPVMRRYMAEHSSFRPGGLPGDRLDECIEDLLSGIKQGAERITKIVDSLKGFVREAPSDSKQYFGVNDALSNAIFLMQNLIRKSTSNFKIENDSQLPAVCGIQQRIEQVIINILQNACQSLRSREEKILVRSYSRNNHKEIVVEIKDEGCGISKDDLSHVTDPFFTTKRDNGGTGLGLSISSSMLKEHNGYFEIESRVNKGTTVRIVIPAVDVLREKLEEDMKGEFYI